MPIYKETPIMDSKIYATKFEVTFGASIEEAKGKEKEKGKK